MKIKDINDYIGPVHEMFPELTEAEIRKILVYGWKMILQYVSAGNDVQIKNAAHDWFFIGQLSKDPLNIFQRYCYKLARRIRYMFKRTKSLWDGYYYFARTENLFADYLAQEHKKYKVFKHVFLYKLLDEVRIAEHNKQYIFRLSEDKTKWMCKYYPEIKTRNAELIEIRDPLKMKDILTSKNKFKYIQR